jgi:GAF domain-containing protein
MSTQRNLDSFRSALKAGGASAALSYLNAGVPHRYSAVYRIEGGCLKNLWLHDKGGEVRPEFLATVPFESSFCQFVIRDGHFTTSDSAADRRLDGHPYQGVMVSYHGVPILSGAEIWGTLCHFDPAALPLAEGEFELLRQAAGSRPGFLPADTVR